MKKRKIHPLKIYSLQYGISYSEIAKKIGISRVYLSSIVNFQIHPSQKVNQKINQILLEEL
jgi:transcriptional regulator with XRE-family HTH domain